MSRVKPSKTDPSCGKGSTRRFTDLQTCSQAKVNKASNGSSASDSGATQSPAAGQGSRQGAYQVQGRQTSTHGPRAEGGLDPARLDSAQLPKRNAVSTPLFHPVEGRRWQGLAKAKASPGQHPRASLLQPQPCLTLMSWGS